MTLNHDRLHWTELTTDRYSIAPCSDIEDLARAIYADKPLAKSLYNSNHFEVSLSDVTRSLESSVEVIEVISRAGGRIGGVLLTSHETSARHGFVTAFASSDRAGPGRLVCEGIGLAIEWLFRHWDLIRIRFDILGTNAGPISSVTRYAEHEGCRRDWLFANGRYWDANLYAISRASWDAGPGRRLVARVVKQPPQQPPQL